MNPSNCPYCSVFLEAPCLLLVGHRSQHGASVAYLQQATARCPRCGGEYNVQGPFDGVLRFKFVEGEPQTLGGETGNETD